MTLSRDILYNNTLSPEDAVLALLGLPLDEGFNNGDLFEITKDYVLQDADTNVGVPAGHYSVTSAESNLVHMIQFNPENKTYGGKEYSVHAKEMEEQIVAGCVKINKYLGEGRYQGTVDDPRQIRAMFTKGYLKKQNRPEGGTDLRYNSRAHPTFQSGTPNPEHVINKQREQRQQLRKAQ